MRGRLGLLAVAALAVAGCGGHSHATPQRNAVASYVTRVDAIAAKAQARLVVLQGEVGANAKNASAARERQLRRSAQILHTLAARVGRMSAPAPAAKLSRLIGRLLESEAEAADEVEGYVRFGPGYAAATKPLAPAQQQLNRALKTVKTTTAQADALDAYGTVVDRVRVQVAALPVVPLTRPIRETEVSALDRVATAVHAFADALHAHRKSEYQLRAQQLAAAATSADSLAAQRLRRDAIAAYDARIAAIRKLAARVQAEQQRLSRSLDS